MKSTFPPLVHVVFRWSEEEGRNGIVEDKGSEGGGTKVEEDDEGCRMRGKGGEC